ncbi:wound-responsive family protein [Tripterygium wilfordii]|uniref:Wound-responsive family protein n=1 Tax=Tripterygium wilfordii TaxID=458696 RepID=A0A7J7DJ03_TRIWF|nr:wound-responsive family protein [Tripterygium wilfordii]
MGFFRGPSRGLAAEAASRREIRVSASKMIYDVNSPLFRSFLSQKGGASDKRKMEEQKPREQRPKANENKPVMNE